MSAKKRVRKMLVKLTPGGRVLGETGREGENMRVCKKWRDREKVKESQSVVCV